MGLISSLKLEFRSIPPSIRIHASQKQTCPLCKHQGPITAYRHSFTKLYISHFTKQWNMIPFVYLVIHHRGQAKHRVLCKFSIQLKYIITLENINITMLPIGIKTSKELTNFMIYSSNHHDI